MKAGTEKQAGRDNKRDHKTTAISSYIFVAFIRSRDVFIPSRVGGIPAEAVY